MHLLKTENNHDHAYVPLWYSQFQLKRASKGGGFYVMTST